MEKTSPCRASGTKEKHMTEQEKLELWHKLETEHPEWDASAIANEILRQVKESEVA